MRQTCTACPPLTDSSSPVDVPIPPYRITEMHNLQLEHQKGYERGKRWCVVYILLSRLPRLPLRKERRLLTYVSKTIDRATCMCPTQCSELEWAGEGGC